MLRVLVLAVLIAAGAVAEASACSCIRPGDPREELSEADAGVYGEVVETEIERDPSGPKPFGDEAVRYRLRVIDDAKDNLGETVDVHSTIDGASCGLSFQDGQEVGLLLYREDVGYVSGLCSMRSREHLAAGREPAQPTGTPPARFLLAGAFGRPRVAALDAAGALLGFGAGTGDVKALAPCPGGRVVLEVVETLRSGPPRYRLVARTVDGLTAGPPTRLPLRFRRQYEQVDNLQCRSEDGAEATAVTTSGRVLRISAGAVTTIARTSSPGLVAGTTVFTRTRAFDAVTGAGRPFGPLPRRRYPLSLSPDGRTLLLASRRGTILAGATTGAVRARTRQPGFDAVWLSDDAVAVQGYRGVVLLDRKLRRIGFVREADLACLTADRGQLVIAAGGRLSRYAFDGTPSGPSAYLFTDAVDALVALPSGVGLR